MQTNNVVTDDSSQSQASQSQSQSRVRTTQLDIFGCNEPTAKYAYLIPLANHYASLWYHFVPWVLCRLEDITINTGETKETMITPTEQWNYFQKCLHGCTSNAMSEAGVGIKHFPTNRIRVSGQANLERWFCFLIIPILSVDEVKNWNGTGYSAIVLAGEYECDDNYRYLAADVYRSSNAHNGMLVFADEGDCNKACSLLQTMILCVCKSSRDTLTKQFREDMLDKEYYQGTTKVTPTYMKSDAVTVPVPMCMAWDSKIRVRKISFSPSNLINENPAPDPVLLLGNAASSWLKRQGLFILPGRYDGRDIDDNDDYSTGSSSSFFASDQEKMEIRGWSTNVFARPPVEHIVHVSGYPGDTIDESLSDIE